MSIRPLIPELAEKARVELNEDPNRISSDIQHIKDWLAKQPHLRARTDDQWLLAFLRGCKYSLERTKEKLDLYYSLRSTAPEINSIKPSDPLFAEILDTGTHLILPKSAAPDAPRVSLMRFGVYNSEKYNITDIVAVSNALHKIVMMEDDNAVVSGVIGITDLNGVNMSHFLQMTPVTMKKMIVAGQDASPFRMKSSHCLNIPLGFETLLNAMKSMLNEKNINRLHVYNKNFDEMYKYIPKDILPAEYGGNGGTLEEIKDYWKQKVKEYAEWLEEDMQYGSDESKRPGKPRTAEDMFGAEGSFRQLKFD